MNTKYSNKNQYQLQGIKKKRPTALAAVPASRTIITEQQNAFKGFIKTYEIKLKVDDEMPDPFEHAFRSNQGMIFAKSMAITLEEMIPAFKK